jgi:hypothetical protein
MNFPITKEVPYMSDNKAPQEYLKTLEKYSKQLHMYAPDQLRSALKNTIGMAKEIIEESIALEAKDISLHQPERRRAKRFPIYSKAEYYYQKDGEPMEKGMLLDISKTGLLLASPTPLEMERELVIMFEINWGDVTGVPVGVVGVIVREQKNVAKASLGNYHYCYGVQFNLPGRVA